MFSASGDGSQGRKVGLNVLCQHADLVKLTPVSSVRGIGYMQNMRAFKTVCPLRNQLHLDITTAIKVQKTEEPFLSPFTADPESGVLKDKGNFIRYAELIESSMSTTALALPVPCSHFCLHETRGESILETQ